MKFAPKNKHRTDLDLPKKRGTGFLPRRIFMKMSLDEVGSRVDIKVSIIMLSA